MSTSRAMILALGVIALLAGTWAGARAQDATPTPPPVETETLPPTTTPDPDRPSPSPSPPAPTPHATPAALDPPPPESAGDAAPQADLTAARLALAGVTLPPTGSPVDEGLLLAGDTLTPLAWGETLEGDGIAQIVLPAGAGLWLDGPGWAVELPGPDAALTVTGGESITLVLRRMPYLPALPPVAVRLGEIDLTLTGANALLTRDPDAGTHVYVFEGKLALHAPESRTLRTGGQAAIALHLHIAPDGAITQAAIPLPDAIAALPPAARDLTVTLDMAQPAGDRLGWLVLLDLDGDPATGRQPPAPPGVYAGLGADLVIRVEPDAGGNPQARADLLINDVINGERLNIRLASVPVTATLSADGQRLTVRLALVELYAALRRVQHPVTRAPVPIVFDPDRLRWRAAALWVAADGREIDAYPDTSYRYPAPDGSPPTPSAPVVQSCRATVTVNGAANVRRGPGTDSAVLDVLPNGTPVEVIGQDISGEWFQLQLPNDVQAWIAGFLLAELDCPAGYTLPVTQ